MHKVLGSTPQYHRNNNRKEWWVFRGQMPEAPLVDTVLVTPWEKLAPSSLFSGLASSSTRDPLTSTVRPYPHGCPLI